jgi:simple sugar transport system ATP-binding protein
MVHQHFMLVEPMTVLQNVILGLDSGLQKLNIAKLRREVQALCDTYRFNLNVDTKIRDLSVGMQQKVELVKALYRGARILILDEPTAVLTPQEVDDLFEILTHLVKEGKSVIFISHKLWEVMKICEQVTVLRQGEVAGVINTRDTTREALAAMMVGREIFFEYKKTPVSGAEKLLECSNVSAAGNQLGSGLKGVSFHINQGEILGLAGVDGNGQTELAEVLMGLSHTGSGKVLFKGRDVTKTGARQRLDMGFAYVPADRMKEGLIPDFAVWENLVLNTYNNEPYCRSHVLRPALIKSRGEKLVEEYDVRPRNAGALVRSLSGGNQQKVVIAREFSKEPAFILAVQPTRGLDVGAAQFVHQRLMAEKEKGAAVFLISSDLDEVLAVADRVLVIYEGKITGEFFPGELSFPEIGMLMGYGSKTVQTREAAL